MTSNLERLAAEAVDHINHNSLPRDEAIAVVAEAMRDAYTRGCVDGMKHMREERQA